MVMPLDASRTRPLEGGPSFPLRHRLRRLVWGLVWGCLGIWTPSPCHAWRRLLLRLFGARLAATAKVYPGVKVWDPKNLAMESFSCLGRDVNCYAMAPVTIRRYAVVSQGAHLCAGTHDVDDADFQLQVRPIVIGERAWIAAEAFVGPGVTVGDGAVLGARAVLMKDLAAWSIAVGNPARVIRLRRRSG